MKLVATCGDRVNAKFGVRVELAEDNDPVEQLRAFLATSSPRHTWWAPFEWKGNHRRGEHWLSAWGICIDVDYHDANGKHAAPPQEVVAAVVRLIEQQTLPGNVAHFTPRGFRLVAIFADGTVTDRTAVVAAACGFAAQVRQVLVANALQDPTAKEGLRVDQSVVGDLARFLFLANTAVSVRPGESTPRCSPVYVLRKDPVETATLARHAPSLARRRTNATTNGATTATDNRFLAAAEEWVRDQPIDYPRSGGTCPICQHNGCFGRLKDDPTKWACFSAHHGEADGHVGSQGGGCWVGSSLDIEAHSRGCTPRDVLVNDGYLQAPRTRRQAQSPQGPDTFELTDVGNAERFAAEHRTNLKFNEGIGWLAWDGVRWTTGQLAGAHVHRATTAFVKTLHIEAAEASANPSAYRDLLQRAKRASMHSGFVAITLLASRDERLLIDADRLDADPLLLNCPNGVVDLRTGKLQPHDSAYLMTHLAGVAYEPGAPCPLWLRTLYEVFAAKDQDEVIAFIQRAVGYTLTGLTKEEVFFMLWGDGRNGKGTIVDQIRKVMGSYARTASMALFLAQKHDSSKQFELAGLQGARMVIASEAGAERSFDTAVVKAFTGGDKRKACHKHKPFFEYPPNDKLWLQVNDKPKVPSWDTAFQERCRLIPFSNQFTEEHGNIDHNRKADLEKELPGILAWAIQGCLRYLADGLRPPKRVRVAVEEYRTENTRVDEFLEQHFLPVNGADLHQSRVYACYRNWCDSQGVRPVAETRFGQHLRDAGYETRRSNSGRIVVGIGTQQGVHLPEGRGAAGRSW